jgi:hypothetical protein
VAVSGRRFLQKAPAGDSHNFGATSSVRTTLPGNFIRWRRAFVSDRYSVIMFLFHLFSIGNCSPLSFGSGLWLMEKDSFRDDTRGGKNIFSTERRRLNLNEMCSDRTEFDLCVLNFH